MFVLNWILVYQSLTLIKGLNNVTAIITEATTFPTQKFVVFQRNTISINTATAEIMANGTMNASPNSEIFSHRLIQLTPNSLKQSHVTRIPVAICTPELGIRYSTGFIAPSDKSPIK